MNPQLKMLLKTFVLLCLVSTQASPADPEFQKKLGTALQNTERAVKVLRKQITESLTAPFLPDLYLQLADLLSDRSNTLYYLQMERQKDNEANEVFSKEMSPVIEAQKEAITVYRLILKDFPSFDKRRQTLYRLALALKSIDDNLEFAKTAGQLLKDYPGSEESVGTRLLLSQHYFEQRNYADARSLLLPILSLPFVYQRNLAKYRIGLIDIAEEKFKDAMSRFVDVIRDPALKEQENPYDVSFKSRKVKSDLKREALIDSVRAYTYVYEKNADPVGFYSKIAPTEIHFQEVIEKLALRYINLKKYDSAIRLLRTMSERTVDPQKILNVYQQVLLTIPPQQRVYIPADEIRFLLQKHDLWMSYYQITPKTVRDSTVFLEKQVRELGTTSHSLAKTETDATRKSDLLKRGRDFYLLYLSFFPKQKEASKMAANLADVDFLLGDYLASGEYYLRTFEGEFGPALEKKALIENALLCLQKKKTYSFYEQLRSKGLLIKSIQIYFAFDPKLKNDVALNFLLVKTQYEQGFFPDALFNLYSFMKRFKKDRQAVDAGEMLLDYFNTRNDFTNMDVWAGKILTLKLPNEAFNQKVARIRTQAKSQAIHERVRSLAGYDDFSQGKSYLNAALVAEGSLKNIALQEALNKSKSEADIQTFLKVATLMADKEKNSDKKGEILLSVAREHAKVTQYEQALIAYAKILKDKKLPDKTRVTALEESIGTVLLMRDWTNLKRLINQPQWSQVAAATKSRVRDQLADLIEAPVPGAQEFIPVLLSMELNDVSLLALYKSQYRAPEAYRARINEAVQKKCPIDSRVAVCLWLRLSPIDARRAQLSKTLDAAPLTMQGIQTVAPQVMEVSNAYRNLEGSTDLVLETAVSLRNADVFLAFGHYLQKAANANADLKAVLNQKAQETLASAKGYQDACTLAVQKSVVVKNFANLCGTGRSPATVDVLKWQPISVPGVPTADPGGDKIEALKKKMFAGKESADSLLQLAKAYLNDHEYHHAVAAAAYGISAFKEQDRDYKAILGCGVLKLGFYAEAEYHLSGASTFEGLAERCIKELDTLKH